MKSGYSALISQWLVSCVGILLLSLGMAKADIEAAGNLPSSFSGLVGKAAPGVVNIMATKKLSPQSEEQFPLSPDDPFRDFFDRYFSNRMPREYEQAALGTGFVVDEKGLILTSNHVVENSIDIKVRLENNREFDAELVGRDPKTDVALIKIVCEKPLTRLAMGDSDTLQVGDWVVAIGNPFGFGNTVTAGIVSAKYRQIGAGAYTNYIQVDAAINPGNSGGPLLNLQGEVVGLNSLIFSETGNSVGIGFAVPVNTIKALLPQLRRGNVQRSYIGVAIQDVTEELRKKLGFGSESGALVSDVIVGGPADKAGIRRGDVIVAFDGQKIRDAHALSLIVEGTAIEKTVEVEIDRAGSTGKVMMVTEQMQEEEEISASELQVEQFGLVVQTLTPELAAFHGLLRNSGLLVVNVEPVSAAAAAGLQPGDIIVEIDQQEVAEVSDIQRLIVQRSTIASFLLLVSRDGATFFTTLEGERASE